MRINVKYLLIIILAVLVVVSGMALYILHHYTDYDLSTVLKNPKTVYSVQNTQVVSSLSHVHHVFVIFEENHDWSSIYNNVQEAPFINKTLLTEGAYAGNYHNISPEMGALHPSEPSYILAESGKIAFPDHTFTSDGLPGINNSTSSHDHLTYLLDKGNLSWKSYQEDISGTDCPINQAGNYAPKHNPFVYFQDVSGNPPSTNNAYCQNHIRPLTELKGDLLTGNLANYTFITPNIVNDMHSGSVKQADSWLSEIIPQITDSETYKKDGAIFITWDEGSGDADENNPIGMIILSPYIKPGYSNSLAYSHASLVKTVEEIFHLSPLLGFAGDKKTVDLSDFFR